MTLLLTAAFVASVLLAAAPASAVTPPDPVVVPPFDATGCEGVWAPVDGGPCMATSGGVVLSDVQVHLIFWLPSGTSFAPGVPDGDATHIALVQRLFADLSGSQTYNVLSQYGDGPPTTSDPTRGYHPNRVQVVNTFVDTRPFPRAPLSQTDVEAEITTVARATGWPARAADRKRQAYFVFTPVGAQMCLNAPADGLCSGAAFAGVHTSYRTPLEGSTADCAVAPTQCTSRAYAYVPTLGAGTAPPYPNNAFVDPVLDTAWHELAETVSDPFGTGWKSATQDVNFQDLEMADVCNPLYMPDGYGPRGTDGGNVTLNGDRYLLQRVYSDAARGCTLGFHGQFINFAALAAKTTASPPFALTADATSTLPVAYAASGPCTVSAAVVTVTGVGSCTITASQAGDRPAGGFYQPAAPVAQTFAITLAPVAVTTTSLPTGQVDVPYSVSLSASFGVTPYVWALQSGALPPGLTLTAGGTISGTPSATGTSNVVVKVTDATGPSSAATKALTITIANGPFRITTSSLPNARLGVPYSQALTASDGTAPYKWKKLTKLPPGLKLDANTGVISGTPKKVRGTFTLTVQARYKTKLPKQAAVWHTANRTLSITVT